MTPQEIYASYQTMPALQLHQLRVAAVAKTICDSIKDFPDSEAVVIACLLHDMGNILKFDLSYYLHFTEPEGLDYWQSIKDEYREKYGPDEHVATQMIVEDVTSSKKVSELTNSIGFSQLSKNETDPWLAKKICAYADMRVSPQGVVPIEERLSDARKRYEGRKDKAIASDNYESLAQSLREIEKQIFAVSTLMPEDITDESIVDNLKMVASISIKEIE